MEKIQFYDKKHKKLRTIIIKNFSELDIDDVEGEAKPIDEVVAEKLEKSEKEPDWDSAQLNLLFKIRNQLRGLDGLIIYLRYFRGMSQSKIARFLGCSQYYVFTRLRAIKVIIKESPECRRLWEELENGGFRAH